MNKYHVSANKQTIVEPICTTMHYDADFSSKEEAYAEAQRLKNEGWQSIYIDSSRSEWVVSARKEQINVDSDNNFLNSYYLNETYRFTDEGTAEMQHAILEGRGYIVYPIRKQSVSAEKEFKAL